MEDYRLTYAPSILTCYSWDASLRGFTDQGLYRLGAIAVWKPCSDATYYNYALAKASFGYLDITD
jgi:hypothetical protein